MTDYRYQYKVYIRIPPRDTGWMAADVVLDEWVALTNEYKALREAVRELELYLGGPVYRIDRKPPGRPWEEDVRWPDWERHPAHVSNEPGPEAPMPTWPR